MYPCINYLITLNFSQKAVDATIESLGVFFSINHVFDAGMSNKNVLSASLNK